MKDRSNDIKREIDGLDLFALALTVWHQKFKILAFTAVSCACASLYALSTPPLYHSFATLMPKSESGSGALAGFASRISGAAALAGLPAGFVGSNVGDSALALGVLRSRQFFETYLYQEMLVEMHAAKRFDIENSALVLDSNLYDATAQQWVAPQQSLETILSKERSYRKFLTEHLKISESENSGFVTIGVTHISPNVAKNWVELVIDALDEAIRFEKARVGNASIRFLQAKQAETRLAFVQESIANLLEEQIKSLMMINAEENVVYQIIDPPYVPEQRISPNRAVIVSMTFFISLILSIAFVIFSELMKEARIMATVSKVGA